MRKRAKQYEGKSRKWSRRRNKAYYRESPFWSMALGLYPGAPNHNPPPIDTSLPTIWKNYSGSVDLSNERYFYGRPSPPHVFPESDTISQAEMQLEYAKRLLPSL
jgi:hypothetical protein